ncbi:unnamed protein product [Owenia fusiformis]|uniref:tRNA pseudouridine synthase n=1 Tax=Owenia fusiformis TaxID=6347 RepID=A0A8S4N2X1_OWEFU|nr:unnamed protein product [Owenia fusiformis]
MGRYLFYISYEGTPYRGLAHGDPGSKSVFNVLKDAILRGVKPGNDFKLSSSSRTDAGVHAIANTLHTDLHKYIDGTGEYEPVTLVQLVNKNLRKRAERIRVVDVKRVNDDFHSRFYATSRTYLYRIAVRQEETDIDYMHRLPISVFQADKVAYISKPFDEEKLREAATILTGKLDFAAFSAPRMIQPWQNTVKDMQVSVHRGMNGFLDEHTAYMRDKFQYWDLIFNGNSFLYHQVRKMTGAMVQSARNRISLDDVRAMIDRPNENHDIYGMPAHGLYLKSVNYKEEDLVFTGEEGLTKQKRTDGFFENKEKIRQQFLLKKQKDRKDENG